MAKVMPKMKLVPQKDLGDMAFRDPKKKHLVCLIFVVLYCIENYFNFFTVLLYVAKL